MGAVSQALGLSGEQGEYFQPTFKKDAQMALQRGLQRDSSVDQRLNQYALGQKSYEDLMKEAQANMAQGQKAGGDDPWAQNLADFLATSAGTGSKYATEQVQKNPILGQLFGQGGTMQRTGQEEQDLAQRGFSLKPEDYEAYGQASGDIARLFGTQEQSLAQSLADRGLASAPSGVAGAAYSGLMGNKFEKLAREQRAVADQRMQMNLARLGQTRQFLSQLGAQGADAINQQFGRQMAGRQQRVGELQAAAGGEQAQNAAENQANLASMQQKIAQKGTTFGEMLGAGLGSTAYNIGAAPGETLKKNAQQGGSATQAFGTTGKMA